MVVESINSILGQSLNSFLDMALMGVGFMIVWYIGKFFFVAPPTKEEKAARHAEDDARRANTRTRVEKEWEDFKKKSKDNEQQEKREAHARYAYSLCLQAIRTAEELREIYERTSDKDTPSELKKRERATEEAQKMGKHLQGQLENVDKALRTGKNRTQGEIHTFFDQLWAYSGTTVGVIENLNKNIPDPQDRVRWDTHKKEIIDHIKAGQGVIPRLGVLIDRLDKYIKKGEHNSP